MLHPQTEKIYTVKTVHIHQLKDYTHLYQLLNAKSTHHCHRKCYRSIHIILNLANEGSLFNTYLIASNYIIKETYGEVH